MAAAICSSSINSKNLMPHIDNFKKELRLNHASLVGTGGVTSAMRQNLYGGQEIGPANGIGTLPWKALRLGPRMRNVTIIWLVSRFWAIRRKLGVSFWTDLEAPTLLGPREQIQSIAINCGKMNGSTDFVAFIDQ